jgi:arabinofuranan 3-O-arabinosyltransferase
LLACTTVVYLIVRRRAAVALVLASPFTAWNIGSGQTGLLTGALVGASLLLLERRPVVAGVFIGCLTYKPQFGILFPVALVAAKAWRAIISAAATTALLAGISIAAFGTDPWAEFPRQLAAQSSLYLGDDPNRNNWGLQDTVYGLVHYLGGGAAVAWLAQGITTFGAALIIWLLWRSRARYKLKAATLAAASLIATPYAFAYEMAAVAVPLGFLAKDQIDCGLLPGEQTVIILLFLASLAVYPTAGAIPIGVPVVFALLYLILRRVLWWQRRGTNGSTASQGHTADLVTTVPTR